MSVCLVLKKDECFRSAGPWPHQPVADLAIFLVFSLFGILSVPVLHWSDPFVVLLRTSYCSLWSIPQRLCPLNGLLPMFSEYTPAHLKEGVDLLAVTLHWHSPNCHMCHSKSV